MHISQRDRINILVICSIICSTIVASSVLGWPRAAIAAVQPKAPVTRLVLGPDSQRYLLRLYAAYRHIPVTAIAGIAASPVLGARVSADGTDWALMRFLPRPSPALAASFQDGAGIGIFARTDRGQWKMAGLGGEPVGCGDHLPSSVRRIWRLSGCPAPAASRVRHLGAIAASSVTDQLASIATDQVGVSDNPAVTNFNGLDCNPFTTLEAPWVSRAGCGRNAKFNVTDASEFWCADFVKWVWARAGVTSDLGVLTPSAASFYAWGRDHGEYMPRDPGNPKVGDAVVFYPGTTPNANYADHVGIITGVNQDGTVNLVNGDFLGSGNISVQENDRVSLGPWSASVWGAHEDWTFVSPQLSTANRSPAAAVDGHGNRFVFWKNPGGGLEEAYYTAASGRWKSVADITAGGRGMGPLGSSPTVAVGPDTSTHNGYAYQYVFWEGTGPGHSLWEAYWNGTWHGPFNRGDGPLGSAPTAGADASGKQYVFWENTNLGLQEMYYNRSSWIKISISGMGPLGSSPTVAVSPRGRQYVFWQGTGAGAHLYETYWNRRWHGPIRVDDGALGSPPTAGVDSAERQYVFWEGGGGGLQEMYYNGSSWIHIGIPGMGPLGSSPTVGVSPGGRQYVFWQGTGRGARLYEAYWSRRWHGPINRGYGPLG
jgi:hypothetical protein